MVRRRHSLDLTLRLRDKDQKNCRKNNVRIEIMRIRLKYRSSGEPI